MDMVGHDFHSFDRQSHFQGFFLKQGLEFIFQRREDRTPVLRAEDNVTGKRENRMCRSMPFEC
jgi:hypothetical protein